jgi:hypothetical protein
LWIYGGITSKKSPKYLNDIWVYSLIEETWTRVNFITQKGAFDPEPLAFHTMTPVFSRKIIKSDNTLDTFTSAKYEKLNVSLFSLTKNSI